MSESRTLNDVLRDMAMHSLENPTHGDNCACKDQWLREGRAMLGDPMKRELSYFTRVMEQR